MSMLTFFNTLASPALRAIETPAEGPEGLVVPAARWYVPVKGVLDFAAALVLLVLTLPLMLLAMALVKLTSPGPALYMQTRLGRHGRPFTLSKVRTMTHNCESLTGACWSKPGDARITPLGRWLRRTHLDELPQLWNVLRGDMSLIGPRPERPEFLPQLEQAIPHYRQRLHVRPGVTGLAQVQLPPDTDLDSVLIKTAYDLYYIRRLGPLLDLRIYGATLAKMAGVPFRAMRVLFSFPHRDVIEKAYRTLPGRVLAIPAAKQPHGTPVRSRS
jgi:lipopolysaccharide/colanic/teichoic acid biosynthesis glycosyltransferase